MDGVVSPHPFEKEGEEARVGNHEGEKEARAGHHGRGCIDFRFISLVAFVGEISLAGPLVKIALSNSRVCVRNAARDTSKRFVSDSKISAPTSPRQLPNTTRIPH